MYIHCFSYWPHPTVYKDCCVLIVVIMVQISFLQAKCVQRLKLLSVMVVITLVKKNCGFLSNESTQLFT